MEPRRMTLLQFLTEGGYATDYDVQGHIHAGLRSAPQTKTYQRWNAKRLRDLQDSRAAGIAAYRTEVEAGHIIDPSPAPGSIEALQIVASGHDDNPSVQAARRLLAKKLAAKGAAP